MQYRFTSGDILRRFLRCSADLCGEPEFPLSVLQAPGALIGASEQEVGPVVGRIAVDCAFQTVDRRVDIPLAKVGRTQIVEFIGQRLLSYQIREGADSLGEPILN